MRCVSFGYAGKKLLIPLVTVFIVIVSCCVSPSAFLLTQGHSGVPFDLCREGLHPIPIGTLTAGNGPFSSSDPETGGLPAELVNLTEPTGPASLINFRMRNKTFFQTQIVFSMSGQCFSSPGSLENHIF